jgi:hypothetical protein
MVVGIVVESMEVSARRSACSCFVGESAFSAGTTGSCQTTGSIIESSSTGTCKFPHKI